MLRHILATFGSIFALAASLGLPAANAGLPNPPLILDFICCLVLIWATVIWWPLSAFAEYALIELRGWRWWQHTPAVAALCCLAALAVDESLALLFSGSFANLAVSLIVAGLQGLWGTLYWIVYRLVQQAHVKVTHE